MSDRDCEKCKHHTEKGCDSWDCKFEQGMKRKEIIEMLKVLKEQALKSHNDTAIIDVKKDSFIYVMNVTINSLEIDERYELEYEQIEPCEDAISRQAVLDAIEDDNRNGHYSCFASNNDAQCFKGVIGELPSVNPQDKYKKAAMDLLAEYLESEQSVISEFSGDFKKSAMMLKKRVMKYLKRLDESENTFNGLVKDMWIADYYEAESEAEHG